MSTLPAFDRLSDRVSAGERLTESELIELARSPDILRIGMLADTARRQLRGNHVTFLRVAHRPYDADSAEGIAPAAREWRMTGGPENVSAAVRAIERAKSLAGDRTVSGLSFRDAARLAAIDGTTVGGVLSLLRGAGLDALAELPLDLGAELEEALDTVSSAGFERLRVTVESAPAAERTPLILQLARWQARHGRVQALNPLPTVVQPFRPTTGYEDVRAVAVARLAAPDVPVIQIDWARYGPKLAQVALTFGADDLDTVPADDMAPEGRRRSTLEELRRNIVAAGLTPAERDGRFGLVS